MLLQQLMYEINDKIYFLQEPKKSASAVALLQNQLYNTIKELKISASTVTSVRSLSETRKWSKKISSHSQAAGTKSTIKCIKIKYNIF